MSAILPAGKERSSFLLLGHPDSGPAPAVGRFRARQPNHLRTIRTGRLVQAFAESLCRSSFGWMRNLTGTFRDWDNPLNLRLW